MIGFWAFLMVIAVLLTNGDGIEIYILMPVIGGFIGGTVLYFTHRKELEDEYDKRHGKRS